jgi:hypothetical protein
MIALLFALLATLVGGSVNSIHALDTHTVHAASVAKPISKPTPQPLTGHPLAG